MFATESSSSMNPITLIIHVLYDVASTMTGLVGLTPLQVAEIGGVIFLLCALYGIIQGMRGKTKFTLEDD